MDAFLGLVTFTFLILTIISGLWWLSAKNSDRHDDIQKEVRQVAFSISFIGFCFFFWMIY